MSFTGGFHRGRGGGGNDIDLPISANDVLPTTQRQFVSQAEKDEINNHIVDKNNPHEVTKEQIGLENVENYEVATQEEAEDGIINNKYMTPLRTKEAIDKNLSELEIGGVNLISHNPNDWIEMPFAFETKDYIPVKPETPYTLTDFSRNSVISVWAHIYDEEYNHLRNIIIENNESLTFKTRTNERYVKITIAVDDNVLDKIGNEYKVQLERGGFVTDWKPRIDDVNNSIIVESGKNANGHYVKWANGLMICWGQAEATDVTATVQRNFGGYRSTGIPIPFAATFHTSGGVPKLSAYFSVPDLEGKLIYGSNNYSSAQFVVHTINQVTSPIPLLIIGYTAVGRWKDYD